MVYSLRYISFIIFCAVSLMAQTRVRIDALPRVTTLPSGEMLFIVDYEDAGATNTRAIEYEDIVDLALDGAQSSTIYYDGTSLYVGDGSITTIKIATGNVTGQKLHNDVAGAGLNWNANHDLQLVVDPSGFYFSGDTLKSYSTIIPAADSTRLYKDIILGGADSTWNVWHWSTFIDTLEYTINYFDQNVNFDKNVIAGQFVKATWGFQIPDTTEVNKTVLQIDYTTNHIFLGNAGLSTEFKADTLDFDVSVFTGLPAETDPFFSAWDKSTGVSITESQISDFGTYLIAEVDGSITNEIEVVNETYNATNFNSDNTSGVSQNNFYDYNHISDADDDGKIDIVDLASAGFVKTNASGVLSVDVNTYLTSADLSTYMLKAAFDDSFNINIASNDQNWKTTGRITGDYFAVLDSAGAPLTMVNYVDGVTDYTIMGNSDRRLVLKGGNSTDAIDIDDGITNINQLTLDNDLANQYLDGDLESIGNLAGTTGFAKKTAANTWTLDTNTYLTAEVDGSITNEIEVVNETYNATNFNNDNTSGVSQNNFYDYNHISDADDDGKIDIVDLASAGFVKTNASGVLSVDANIYLTSETGDISGVTAGSGLSGGGTSGSVTLSLDGADARNYDVTNDTHNWLTTGSITSTGSIKTSNYLHSGLGFTILDSSSTQRLVMNYINVTGGADYNLYGSSLFKSIFKGGSTVNSLVIDKGITTIYDLDVLFDVDVSGDIEADEIIGGTEWRAADIDISSYTNLTMDDPLQLDGDNLEFQYETTDFSIDGEGVFGIKALSITYADIANSTIDTTKINDTQFYQYIYDHSAEAATSIGFWDYIWLGVEDLYRTDGSNPNKYEFASPEIVVFEFDGVVSAGSEDEVKGTFTLPIDVVPDSGLYFAVSYYPDNTTTNDIVWEFDFRTSDASEAYSSDLSRTITVTNSFTNTYRYLNHSSVVTILTLLGGAEIPFVFSRQPNNVGDTYTGDMYLSKVGIKVFRKLEND